MRDAYRSLLTVLGAVLALWLILGFWPLSTGSRVALSLLVVLVSGVMFWRQRRASQARATAIREIVDENLPPEDFQGAVILVCGDNSPLFVSGSCHRETRQGWYLWVKDAEQLPLLAQHLSLVRPALVSQISVMLAVVPEQHTFGDDFTQSLRGWQRAVVRCRAAFGTIPPLWTVTWVSPPVVCAEAEPVWFTTVSPRSGIQVYQSGQGNVSLTDWTQEIGTDGRLSRLSHGLWLDSLLAWQNSAVNDLLSVRREGDLTVLARRYEWDMDAIWQDLLAFLDTLPRSVRSRPQLSDSIQTLMQDAWLHASLAGEEHIRSIHLLMALVDKPKLAHCDGLWPLLTLGQGQLERLRPLLDAQSDERPEVQQEAELAQNHGGEVEFVGSQVGAGIKEGELTPALQNALDKFTIDVTAKAKEGKIDPVFGRDTEIRQMVDILSRRRKNNPILVGEPGVGKTALVEGLALRIAEGNVPESLKPVVLRTLDLGLLQAGTTV